MLERPGRPPSHPSLPKQGSPEPQARPPTTTEAPADRQRGGRGPGRQPTTPLAEPQPTTPATKRTPRPVRTGPPGPTDAAAQPRPIRPRHDRAGHESSGWTPRGLRPRGPYSTPVPVVVRVDLRVMRPL